MSNGIAAIDVGTGRVKGCVFDEKGRVVTFAEEPMPQVVLNGREATQDLAAVFAAFQKVHAQVKGAGVLALTTQRGTGIAVGPKNEAIGPLISWLDRRPRAELAGPKGLRSLHAHLFLQLTGRALETTQTGVAGGAVEVVPIGEVAHGVVACGGDKNSELVGAGCIEEGEAVLSLGTALSLGMLMHGMTPDPARTFTTAAHVFGLKQVEIGLPYGGEVPAWLERTLDSFVKDQPDPDGPLFLPYLMGSLADSQARARWVGVTAETSEADLMTAGMAGLVLDVMNQISQLPRRPELLSIVGGGANDPILVQWFADALACPVSIKIRADAGLSGAAMVAAVATGRCRDWAEAKGTYAVPEARRIAPDPARAPVWNRLLARFRAELGCISGTQKL